MSLPASANTYLHRSGRTGRLDRAGTVITFIKPEEVFVIKRHSNELGINITLRNIVMKVKSDCIE